MDYWGIVGVEEQHAFGDLAGDADLGLDCCQVVALVQEVEEGCLS
jgi:hypothetical protein